ncbi:MAG: nucleoside-diphosphate sugar epimerase [Acidobacteria bacterium]|nr:nucleoside-diphosphate sugar epimerase [Acidobacteriota bacterium]|tara:strand:+ start:265 stop:1236 length:972 start_codon:yes stop_codon:yes gene_type:complete
MRALITGGAGFVGSHLAEALLQKGHHVFVLDDLSTGKIDNIEHLKSHDRFGYLIGSVLDETVLAELVEQCDVVFHLAAVVGVKLIIDEPVRTIETNVHGTEVVLRCAARHRRPVLIVSTSEVYGKGIQVPFREGSDLVLGATTQHRWAYACSKAIDEFLGLAYWKEKRVPVIITRLFNTVGPRQRGRYGMVIPNFVRQALSGGPITVFGDGRQTRCFGYVGDVVQALIGLATDPRAVGEVFNVGNDEEISIETLAKKIKLLTNSQAEIVKIPYHEAYEPGFEDMFRRVPDIRKVKELLNWRPEVGTDELLTKIIEYTRQSQSR